jgi:hypothetical protein
VNGSGRSQGRSKRSGRKRCDTDPKTALAQSYGLGSRTLCNARPTFEAIIRRRRSRRPTFQPKRQKATPTSTKQAMLSTPCTICSPSVLKNAPLLSSTNPVIAPRIMVAPSKQKSVARTGYSKHENRAGRRHALPSSYFVSTATTQPSSRKFPGADKYADSRGHSYGLELPYIFTNFAPQFP